MGGIKGANGSKSVSVNTEYIIDTGLSNITTFTVYGAGRNSGNAGTVVIYDSRRSSSTLQQGGGSNDFLNKGSTLPLANSTNVIGITSINGGKVTVKTPTSDTCVAGMLYWSATGT